MMLFFLLQMLLPLVLYYLSLHLFRLFLILFLLYLLLLLLFCIFRSAVISGVTVDLPFVIHCMSSSACPSGIILYFILAAPEPVSAPPWIIVVIFAPYHSPSPVLPFTVIIGFSGADVSIFISSSVTFDFSPPVSSVYASIVVIPSSDIIPTSVSTLLDVLSFPPFILYFSFKSPYISSAT